MLSYCIKCISPVTIFKTNVAGLAPHSLTHKGYNHEIFTAP